MCTYRMVKAGGKTRSYNNTPRYIYIHEWLILQLKLQINVKYYYIILHNKCGIVNGLGKLKW